MKRKVLALAVSAIMALTAVVGIMVSAADSSYDASANAPFESVVLSDTNLLYAGGADVSFEDSTVGATAKGFATFGTKGSGNVIDTAANYGSKSMMIADGWSSATGNFTVDLKKDKYYTFSFWYFCEPGGANSIMTIKDQSGTAIKDVNNMGSPESDEIWYSGSKDGVWDATNCGEWKFVERIICPAADVTRLDVIINGAGISYYDDFCVIEIGDSLPTPEPTPTAEPTPEPTPTPEVSEQPSDDPIVTDPPVDNEDTVAKSVKFTKKTVNLKKGKKATLKVKIKGAKKAKFSVDKKSKKIVKVLKTKKTSITVKGKKKGTAKVVAKVGKKKATCKVKVK